MNRINISLRKTFRYVGTWKHLDEWEDLPGLVALTPLRPVTQQTYEGGVYIRWAKFPKKPTEKHLRALEHSLSRQGCAHDYDCCGCTSYYTSVKHRHGRRVVLQTTAYSNY